MNFFGTVNLTLNLGSGSGNVNGTGNGMSLIDDSMINQHIPRPQPNAVVNHGVKKFNVVPNQTTVANQNDILPETVGGQFGLHKVSETKKTYVTTNGGVQVHTVTNYAPLAKQPSIQFGSFNNEASSLSSGSSGWANTNLISVFPRMDRVNSSFLSLLQNQTRGRKMGSPQPLNSVHDKERSADESHNKSFSSLLQNQMTARNMDQPRPLNTVHGKEPCIGASTIKVAESPSTNQAPLFRKPLLGHETIKFTRRARVSEKKPLPDSSVTAKESAKIYEQLFQESQKELVYNENGVIDCSPISFRLPDHVSNQKTTPYLNTHISLTNGKSKVQIKKKRVYKRKKVGNEPKEIKQHGPYFCKYCYKRFEISQTVACHTKVHYKNETPEETLLRRSTKNKKKRVKTSQNPDGVTAVFITSEKPDATLIETATTMTKVVQETPSSSTIGTKEKEVKKEDGPVFENVMEHLTDVILVHGTESG